MHKDKHKGAYMSYNTERAKLGRIKAVIDASEKTIANTKTQMEKINAVITAYEHIVKILNEEE